MKLFHRIPFALSLLAATASQSVWAAPTSGAYTTDKQNTWVQDRVGDRIGTVNMIMCILGSMRADAMVNQGAYIALIDQGKCQGRGDSSKSTSTSAGASNATDYMSAIVQSTQASSSAPLIMKAWLSNEEENGGSPVKVTIFVYVVATEGKTETHPNGLFKMYFCGEPESMSGTCMFSGSLQSTDAGLSFYQAEAGGGGGSSTTRLILQNSPSTDSGLGKISGVDGGSSYSYQFAYDANHFRRKEGSNPDVCFARDHTLGETSTWRYGTYNTDGSRLDIANPGFPVKYVNGSDTYYGYWSFWGLWLPESAMSGISQGQGTLTRKNGSTDETITPIQKGGKLWRLAKHDGTMADFKNVPMMYWSASAIGSGTPFSNYEVQWDGTNLNAVAYMDCSGGNCTNHPLASAQALSATTLRGSSIRSMPVFFPAGGGNGVIQVPATGEFDGATTVSYRTRDVVSPSASDIGLNCLNNCPNTGTNLVSTQALSGTPFQDGSPTWGPVGTRYQFTFHSGMVYDGAFDTAHAVDASGAAKDQMGQYQWGLNSGSMVSDADLNSIRCDADGSPNTAGTYYCSYLLDRATTIYQWETGPNQWNQYFGANGITIDPPKALNLDVQATFTGGAADSTNNIRGGGESQLSKFNGNKVQLQFSGFGELQGVPGNCVDPDTNLPTQCGQNVRWVPAFDIVDGSAVTDNSSNYFVKYLEREMRLGKVNCGSVSGSLTLTAAAALTLPTSTLVDEDPKARIGTAPTPTSTKPAVIDGIVQ